MDAYVTLQTIEICLQNYRSMDYLNKYEIQMDRQTRQTHGERKRNNKPWKPVELIVQVQRIQKAPNNRQVGI